MDRHKHLTPNTRSILIDWLIDVAAECKLSNITLGCGVALVDRCLAVCEYRREVDLKYVNGKCRYYEKRETSLSMSRNKRSGKRSVKKVNGNGKGRKRKRSEKKKTGLTGRGRRRRCSGEEEDGSSSCNDYDNESDCDFDLSDKEENLSSDDEEEDEYNGRLVIGSNTLQLLGWYVIAFSTLTFNNIIQSFTRSFTYILLSCLALFCLLYLYN